MTLRNYLPVEKADCLTLTKALQFYESLVTLYQSTRPNIPEDFKTAAKTSDLPGAGRLSRGENKNEGLVYFYCDCMTHFSSVVEDGRRFK
jgi:hypothetical protein